MIVIQAIRLADLAAARLAYAEGRSRPTADAINTQALVGNLLSESTEERTSALDSQFLIDDEIDH